MITTPIEIRRFEKKDEVKKMKDATIFMSDVEVEIVNGMKRVTLWHKGEELIEIKAEEAFLDTEEAIELLIEKAAKWLGLNVTVLTDAELIFIGAYIINNKIKLRFRDTDTRKIHELNFSNIADITLAEFIESSKNRVIDIVRGNLNVDVVKIVF